MSGTRRLNSTHPTSAKLRFDAIFSQKKCGCEPEARYSRDFEQLAQNAVVIMGEDFDA